MMANRALNTAEEKQAPSATAVPSHPQAISQSGIIQLDRAGSHLLQRQRLFGNRHVQRIAIQARYLLGPVDDKYEREADRLAQHITGTARGVRPTPRLQLRSTDTTAVAPDIASAIDRARGAGKPLPRHIQSEMGHALTSDLSHVRIHDDTRADTLSRAIQARAFTTGSDIFFRRGQFNPHSASGRHLLAHELTHVVQQTGPTSPGPAHIQREWLPDDGGYQQWDDTVGGLIWYRNTSVKGIYFYTFDKDHLSFAELESHRNFAEIQAQLGNDLSLAELQQLGISPPDHAPVAANTAPVALPPSPLLNLRESLWQHILSFVPPEDLAKVFQVSRAFKGSSDDRYKIMRAAFARLSHTDQQRLARQAQAVIPYRDSSQLGLATGFPITPGKYSKRAWKEYQKSSNPKHKQMRAVLYTIRNRAELDYWLWTQNLSMEEMSKAGAIYSPGNIHSGKIEHNIFVNKVWLLGVIHSGRDVVLLTPLTGTSLTRGYSAHPEKQNLPQHEREVSALGREVLGVTTTTPTAGRPFFEPQQPQARPLEAAEADAPQDMLTVEFKRTAVQGGTLAEISYPDDMTTEQAIEELARRQVPLPQTPSPSPASYIRSVVQSERSAFLDELRATTQGNAAKLKKTKGWQSIRAELMHDLRDPEVLPEFVRYWGETEREQVRKLLQPHIEGLIAELLPEDPPDWF